MPAAISPTPFRLGHFFFLAAAAIALACAISPEPMRWYLRASLLLGGFLVGTHLLRRLNEPERGGTFWSWVKWAFLLLFWCKVVGLAVQFLGRDAFRYYDFDLATFGTFWPRRGWLIAHITGGTLALVLGPLQFWTGLRRVAWKFHRWTGRAYVFGVGLAGASAFALGPHVLPEEGGLVSGVSMMVLATVWLAATGIALAAILRREIDSHQRWMTRSYVLTFAFVSIRWLAALPMLEVLGPLEQRVPIIIWMAWVGPLLVVEGALYGWRAMRAVPVNA
jgi:hypothetical protein